MTEDTSEEENVDIESNYLPDLDITARIRYAQGLGELPTDLRRPGKVYGPGPINPVNERDAYSEYGGSSRSFLEPAPNLGRSNPVTITYHPRFNEESFRSQRIFVLGSSYQHSDGTLLYPTGLPPSSGSTYTEILRFTIPIGFAGVITGLGQFIGDSTAYNKTTGAPDDISWRISINNNALFDFSNLNALIGSFTEPAKIFAVLSQEFTASLSATNNIVPGSPGAHDIAVRGYLTGHQFPIDEIDDIFRNR